MHGINLTSLWSSISIGFYNSCAHAPFFNAFPLVFTLHDRHSIVFYDENEHFLNAETIFVLALRSSKFFEVLSKILLVSFHRYVFATPIDTLVVPAGSSISYTRRGTLIYMYKNKMQRSQTRIYIYKYILFEIKHPYSRI